MKACHDRFPKHAGLRWAASVGLAAALTLPALSATAQGEVQTSPIAATPANCAIQLSVANPNPGNQEIPRSLVMSGTARDGTATSGTGISQVQAFLGSRDTGGTIIGTASTSAPAGAWSLTASIPPNISGGQQMFVYGMSSVSGQEAVVSIPIVVSEAQPTPTVPDVAQSFCPAIMPASARAATAVAATPQPSPSAIPAAATATPQPTATAIPAVPTPTPAAAPANPPIPAPPPAPAAVQLSISSPGVPPLTFDTTTLTAPVGAQVTVTYTNDEAGVPHNWHAFNGPDSSAPTLAATQIITGPGTMDSVTFTAPTQAGNYFFWCDVHPTIMTGQLVLE
jgi:plastocyanin